MAHIHLIKTKSNLIDEYQLNLWYNRYIKLLKYAETQDYSNTKHYHKHHILPKSLFPEYEHDQDNLIKLSYRLHYIAHYILWKLTKTYQMSVAFVLMHKGKLEEKPHLNSKAFDDATKYLSDYFRNNPEVCTPSKLYWTLDENGNRCRTEDESKKISGAAPWQKGFNSINKERTRFINLITKETEYVLKNEKPEWYHYYMGATTKSKFYIFLFEDIYYFSYLTLPRKIQFNLGRNLDVIDNKIPTIDSYMYKYSEKLDEPRKHMIEQHGGKTLKELGLQVFYFYDQDFKFDFTKQLYDYETRNKHPIKK